MMDLLKLVLAIIGVVGIFVCILGIIDSRNDRY